MKCWDNQLESQNFIFNAYDFSLVNGSNSNLSGLNVKGSGKKIELRPAQ